MGFDLPSLAVILATGLITFGLGILFSRRGGRPDADPAPASRAPVAGDAADPAAVGSASPAMAVGGRTVDSRTPPKGTMFTTPPKGIAFTTQAKPDSVRSARVAAGPVITHDYEKWKEKKLVDELQEEVKELSNLFTLLPGLTKRLNETQRKRDIAPLLCDTVLRICIPPPEKVLIFFLSHKKDHLVLAAKHGFSDGEVPPNLFIPMDSGRVGRAIKRQLALDERDFEREHRAQPIPPTDTYFKTEVCAPIIHNKDVLGAISAEGFRQYNKNAKRLLIVAANLGAIAMANAQYVQQIQHLADSDALTGLYNKRFFFAKLEEEIERAREKGRPLSLFMFDIDHFKKYNDRSGHPAGDEALRITGQIVTERKRESDIACRYGGEEFIVILPGTPKDGGFTFGESLRRAIEAYPYPHGEGQPLGKMTMSGGVATYPEDGFTGSALIEVADANLYRSKELGRNTVTKCEGRYVVPPAANAPIAPTAPTTAV